MFVDVKIPVSKFFVTRQTSTKMTKVLTDENLELYGSCMSSGDGDELDRILCGPVSNKLHAVVMAESPQQPGC